LLPLAFTLSGVRHPWTVAGFRRVPVLDLHPQVTQPLPGLQHGIC
jgi:hypothetical protein